MSESKDVKPTDVAMAAIQDSHAIQLMQDTMENFLSAGDVEAVYGKPVQGVDSIIIPAAEVVSVLGFGVGSGYGGKSEQDEGGGGSGGGGGGRVFSRPVAVIVASKEGVRIEPVVDFTKIALAGLTAGAFMLSMFMRMLNPKKALKDLNQGNWG